MDASLRKKHGAATLDRPNDTVNHHPSRSIKDVDHFFPIGVGMRGPDRLAGMHPSSAEYSIVRTYLDWLAVLPWDKSSRDRLDLRQGACEHPDY